MSVSRESTVWCDGFCSDGAPCIRWHQGTGSPSQVRRTLKPSGWTRDGDKDYCPEHSRARAAKAVK